MQLNAPLCGLAGALILLAACATPPSVEKPQQSDPARAERSVAAVAQAPRPLAAASASAPASAPAPAAPAASPTGGPPSGPPPFATVVREARRIDGPLVLWQKEDKAWIELRPEDFGRPFLLSPKIKSGIGEGWVLGGLMAYPIGGAGGSQLVEFVRVHNSVRLQARNTEISAKPGTPEARAVADSYSHSLLGATAVASQPHPERKSILIEANNLFLSDVMGIGMMLQRAFRQGYSLDRSNTVITALRSSAQAIVIETQAHYYTGSVSTSAPTGPVGGPAPSVPRFLPDARSMLIGLHYSLAPLPDKPMATRRADPRLGLFTTSQLDFGDDLAISPRRRVVDRWRLEKRDPAAELSEPVKPITIWIDRNVPLAYRDTVREAILEWNKAFERIGFKDALVVQQQPDDAAWDTLDFGYSSVRWMMNADPAFAAIGPHHVDPRSGEILEADIAFEGMSARNARGVRAQVLGPVDAAALETAAGADAPPAFAAPLLWPGLPAGTHDHRICQYGALAGEQLSYALDVLEARGELAPEGPQAQRFVLDYVKDAIMHEVGHALGLRHNFRASRVYTQTQLEDPEFTRANGTTGSVMEYNAVNLPPPGKSGGTPFMATLGPYDYWAIEYAYRPAPPGATPEQEGEMLQRIAARSSEPLLAYGTDEDSFYGIDPETIPLDLGANPVEFASVRLAIARDLFRRQETRELSPERDYAVLRRSLNYALADATRAVGVLVRQIGGVRTLRDFPGSGRDPLQPVPATLQRAALDLIADAVLGADGLIISAPLQRRLAPDYLERAETAIATDFSVPARLFELQRAVLAYLMSEWVAHRVLDSVGKFDSPAEAFQLRELYARLGRDVWSELDLRRGSDSIAPARRELQREHVNRIALMVLRPASRADARAMLRDQVRALLPRLAAAARRKTVDADTRAHLLDSADTLRRALEAQMPRLGL